MEPDEGMQEDPTKPQKPQRNIAANVEALRAQKATDADIEAYLRSEGISPDSVAAPTAADSAQLLRETGILGGQPGTPAAPKPPAKAPDLTKINFLSGKVKTPSVRGNAQRALMLGQGIPFGERIEAGLGAMGDKTYEQSLKDLRAFTGELPEGERTGMKLMGGGALGAFGPLARLSPTAAGAVIGGADQLGSADSMSLGARAARTGVGAAGGALLGRALQSGSNYLAARSGETPMANLLARQAARADAASRMYAAAMAEGRVNQVTPQVQQYLQEPEIAARVQELQKLSQFANVHPESPEMLDALSKSFSDEAHAISKGLSVADPSKPNTGRFRLQNIKNQKQGLADALTAPGPATINATGQVVPGPAYMPSLPAAEAEFARHSADMRALLKGVSASQGVAEGRPTANQMRADLNPNPKNISTREGLASFASKAPASQVQAAKEGVFGDIKNAVERPGFLGGKEGRRTLKTSSDLLRDLDPNSPELRRVYQALGLLGAETSP